MLLVCVVCVHLCVCINLILLITTRLQGSLTLVQYVMPAGDELEINPHGNASSSQPYLCTNTSTLQTIKSKLKSASPKETLEVVSREKGGEFFAKSTGDLPCNRQQIYNMNKHQKPLDPLYGLILEI